MLESTRWIFRGGGRIFFLQPCALAIRSGAASCPLSTSAPLPSSAPFSDPASVSVGSACPKGQYLSNYVCEIPAKDVDSIEVSSTKIRQSILAGDLEIAQSYLGHPFFITGNVVYGKQLGRTIGFPTANIQISQPDKIIPPNGVYWVQVELEGGHNLLNGMMNIGVRPTIDSGERSIEVHLLNWSTEIYGKVLKVNILKRSRSEIKFGSLTLLQEQLHFDLQNANAYFENPTNLKLQ